MITRRTAACCLWIATAIPVLPQSSYSGPRPAKKDVPYLLQANRLIETEIQVVRSGASKGKLEVSAPGPQSKSRTPLPEPVFLLASDSLNAQTISLNRFVVKDGNRQVEETKQKAADDEADLRLTVRRLDSGLFRIEAAQMLEAGEYFLLAQGSKQAFCFSVY